MESQPGPPVALAVDDEPQGLRVIVRCLKAEGFEVLAANSRAEAEQKMEKGGSIDVLVTDIFLGDGWGGELAFWLQEKHPNSAVVFISGMAEKDPILRHGIQEHMVFLEKPFTTEELAEAVRRASEGVPGSQSN